MKQTLEQLGLKDGKVSFSEYEYYGNKYMESNAVYINYILLVETDDKSYVFFTGANYRDTETTVSGVLVGDETCHLDEPVTEDMIIENYHDDVLENYNQLLDDNGNWLEEEVNELVEKYGVHIHLSLNRGEVTEHTVTMLSNALVKAQDILKERQSSET